MKKETTAKAHNATGGKKPRQTGKAFELEVARKIKGQRAGYGNLDKPDVSNEWLECECKVMPLPSKLEGALQVVTWRGDDKKMQMVVIKRKGDSWESARIYMSFKEFLEWYG